jgi:hypothetical protein
MAVTAAVLVSAQLLDAAQVANVECTRPALLRRLADIACLEWQLVWHQRHSDITRNRVLHRTHSNLRTQSYRARHLILCHRHAESEKRRVSAERPRLRAA